MSGIRTIDALECAGRRIVVRVDLNVPMRDGGISDATRLEKAAVTLRELAGRGARVVVLSHLGRPGGRRDPALSLAVLTEPLSRALGGAAVRFAPDCIGAAARDAIAGLPPGGVALLENLRFHAGEEANDPQFAAMLAEGADAYVNDAFSAAHRAHASIDALARLLPCHAGRQMQAELEALARALDAAERPVTAVVGGAKVSTKLAVLHNLVTRVDRIIIGGGMANTFLHGRGVDVGRSLAERDLAPEAQAIEDEAREHVCMIMLQHDAVVARALEPGGEARTVPVTDVPGDMMILDVGPVSQQRFGAALRSSATVVWNGPLGAFETPPFHEATVALAQTAAELTDAGRLVSVAGGGDTVSALALAGVTDRFSYVSTAGGAFLEWLEGRPLPGIAVLEEAATERAR